MMYVALRETFDVYPDSKAVRRLAGEEVQTFTTWPVQNQLAALSARIVREIPDSSMPAKDVFRSQHRADVDDAKTRALRNAKELAAKPVSAEVGQSFDVESSDYTCNLCEFVGATARGLAIHRGSAHKAP